MPNEPVPSEAESYEVVRARARRYMRKGLLFLLIALAIGEFASRVDFPFASLIAESSIIIGWVALWRPVEMFLYDLPEMRRKK
jgi:hypothetical protein